MLKNCCQGVDSSRSSPTTDRKKNDVDGDKFFIIPEGNKVVNVSLLQMY